MKSRIYVVYTFPFHSLDTLVETPEPANGHATSAHEPVWDWGGSQLITLAQPVLLEYRKA